MADKKFSAGIRLWTKKTKEQIRAILQDSLFDVLEGAQTSQPSVKLTGGSFEIGKIPVDSSELIRSLVSELNGAHLAKGEMSYSVVISQIKVGDTAIFAWTAPHARPIEYGWTAKNGTEVPGRQFVGHNAATWRKRVSDNTRRITGT